MFGYAATIHTSWFLCFDVTPNKKACAFKFPWCVSGIFDVLYLILIGSLPSKEEDVVSLRKVYPSIPWACRTILSGERIPYRHGCCADHHQAAATAMIRNCHIDIVLMPQSSAIVNILTRLSWLIYFFRWLVSFGGVGWLGAPFRYMMQINGPFLNFTSLKGHRTKLIQRRIPHHE